MQNKSKNKIVVFAFQLCVIANSVLGSDAELFQISKVVMLLFFAVMAWFILARGGKFLIGKQIFLPLAFTVYMITSTLWSYNQGVAAFQLITQLQLMLLLIFTYLAMLDGAEIKDYLDALYIAGWGLAIFALVRYEGLNNYLAIMESGKRMGGEVANENSFGLVFSNAALAAAYYVIVRKRKIDIVSIAVFTFFALSSGSKKATLLIIIGIFAIAIVHFGFKKLYKTILVGLVVLYLANLVLQLPMFETVYERLESFTSGELNESDTARQNMIQFGLDLFMKRPLLGYGLNNYHLFYVTGQYSHNNYVELLVSGGLVGFVLYYLMYLSPICCIYLGSRRRIVWRDRQYLVLLVWLIVDLVFGYGMVQLYGKDSHILIGVVLAAADKLHMEPPKLTGEAAQLGNVVH